MSRSNTFKLTLMVNSLVIHVGLFVETKAHNIKSVLEILVHKLLLSTDVDEMVLI